MKRFVLGFAAVVATAVAANAMDVPAKEMGGVLVDQNGMTLYTFDKDTQGAAMSACTDQCITNWPPLKAPEGAPAYNMLGDVLDVDDMIGVIEDIFPLSKGKITCAKRRNVMANDVTDTGLQALIGPFHPLSYEEGAKRTANLFRTLLGEGRL